MVGLGRTKLRSTLNFLSLISRFLGLDHVGGGSRVMEVFSTSRSRGAQLVFSFDHTQNNVIFKSICHFFSFLFLCFGFYLVFKINKKSLKIT